MTDLTQSILSMPFAQRQALSRQVELALRQNPKNVEAILTASAVSMSEGDTAAATSWLKKALALRKKDPDILLRLATISQMAKDYRNARKYGRKLCEVEPRKAENHQIYATILEQAGDPEGAIRAYTAKLRLKPQDAPTLAAIGRCYGFQGDYAQAAHFYEKALAISPQHPSALYGLANSARFDADEAGGFIQRLEEAAQNQPEDGEAAMLLYSAGKVAEDAREYPRAFSLFSRANAAKRPEGGDIHQRSFDNVEKAFTSKLMKSKAGYGLATRQPIFIVGMPRSGTTLTESICAAHSKVTARDELPYAGSICEALGVANESSEPFVRAIADIPPAGAKAMAEDYLEKAVGPEGIRTSHFTDKMPHNFRFVGFIALILPDAPIIHMRRHPLDNCLSIFSNSMNQFHNLYKTDLVTLGLHYRRYHRLMKHWKSLLPGQMLEVFYEDLVANTELNARKLIDHIGLDWEDGVMDRSGSQRSVRTLSVWQVRQPVYDSSKGKWRRYEKELAPLMEILAPVVEEYEAELAALERQSETSK